LPASKEWCDKNEKLFEDLLEALRIISDLR
jgi:hypothetical protein